MSHLRIVVDGMNAAHRMRHAFAELRTSNGKSTGVLYGFLEMLGSLRSEFDPAEIIFAWDSPRSWRFDMFSAYKLARKEKRQNACAEDHELLTEFHNEQVPDTQKYLSRMGIPQLQVACLEADDIMGMLARYGTNDDDWLFVTTDTDLLQCVRGKHIRVFNPLTKQMWFQDSSHALCATARGAVAPSPTVYLWRKIIIGDTSDSIPGIEGVGEVRAGMLFFDAGQKGESLTAYVKRHEDELKKSKAGISVLSNAAVLSRNLLLMDLSTRFADIGLRKVGGVKAAMEAAQTQYDVGYEFSKTKQDLPRYLSADVNADPTPALIFLRRRQMSIANNTTRWRTMLRWHKDQWRFSKKLFNKE